MNVFGDFGTAIVGKGIFELKGTLSATLAEVFIFLSAAFQAC